MKYKIPNDALSEEAFASRGGWEVWRMLMDMWHRIGRLEMAVSIGGGLLLVLVGAVAGRVFEIW